MRVIKAAAFKAGCLKIMDEVQARREQVLITKKGRPVARLVPADVPPRDVFGCLEGSIQIVGDVLSPVIPPGDWEILR